MFIHFRHLPFCLVPGADPDPALVPVLVPLFLPLFLPGPDPGPDILSLLQPHPTLYTNSVRFLILPHLLNGIELRLLWSIFPIIWSYPTILSTELCPYPNDGRCLLGGGPFSRIAAVMSHNYMIHHPPHNEFKWILKDRSSEFDINRFVTHIHSFLQSIRNKPKE